MLNIEIKKSNLPITKEKNFTTSKKIVLDIGLEVVFQINFPQKNILNVIDNLIIDLVLSKNQKETDSYNSFSILLETLNREIKKLNKTYSLQNLNIFIWIIQQETFHFSILWNYSIYLIKNNKILNIADWMQGKNLEFSYISSWNIWPSDNIYISNVKILDYITKDDIFEISKLKDDHEKINIIERLFIEENINEQYEIILLSNKLLVQEWENIQNINLNEIKEKLLSIKDKIVENEYVWKVMQYIKSKIDLQNKHIQTLFFILWLFCSALLLYAIISSIISSKISSSVPEEYKNMLIEANNIIKNANKDLWNQDVFYNNIKKAEDLIFQVRDKRVFLSDVKKLLDEISILKKQINGIETFVLSSSNTVIQFQDKNMYLNSVFELNKKYYFVWKNQIIWPYVKWEQIRSYPYPDWEEAISSDISSEWYIYILTKTYRVLQFYKQEFKYVNLEWQKTWEDASIIKTFNSNIYLLNSDWNQILKHKPWVNWFSSKISIIDNADIKNLNIIDFALDWWFYVLKKDLSIDKFFTVPAYSKRSILLNKLPKNYDIESDQSPKIFIWQNLNYIYILLNNRIWIFEADSKNFKDVKSLKYIWQLESQQWKVNTIYIPKDGTIFVWTDDWVYSINFEVSDWKIIIRN